MPDPKDGTACTLVPPIDPDVAADADDPQPGAVEALKAQQRETGTGKYGSTPVTPYTPPSTPEERAQKKSWIEIILVDEEGHRVPGKKYQITMPDQSVKVGTLDAKGFARVDGIDPGTCHVTFPGLVDDSWSRA